MKRRIHTYDKYKHRLIENYGTIKECKAVLISEMISDQEDEYDADNEEVRARKAPVYRKRRVN